MNKTDKEKLSFGELIPREVGQCIMIQTHRDRRGFACLAREGGSGQLKKSNVLCWCNDIKNILNATLKYY